MPSNSDTEILRQIRVLAAETGVDKIETRRPITAYSREEIERFQRFGRVVGFLIFGDNRHTS